MKVDWSDNILVDLVNLKFPDKWVVLVHYA